MVAALKAGLKQETLQKEHPRRSELPFESEKRYMATLHDWRDGNAVACVKGSVDKVLAMSRHVYEGGVSQEMSPAKRAEIEERNAQMASKALRVMALAYMECNASPEELCMGHLDGALTLVALVGMIDPPRKEAREAVSACKRAGIKVVMITGDQKVTASAIAEELGLPPWRSGHRPGARCDEQRRARCPN